MLGTLFNPRRMSLIRYCKIKKIKLMPKFRQFGALFEVFPVKVLIRGDSLGEQNHGSISACRLHWHIFCFNG